ncbi:MAG: class I SAM-dependent methyltransferase [Candidatus Aenigmatarchaeota archaeon]
MIDKLYYFLLKFLSKPQEKGLPSSGIWQELVRKTVFSLIKNEGGSILEIGCGEGLFLKKIKKNFKEVVGIDISIEQLQNARKICKNFNFIQADAIKLPFKDKIFDTIVCINFFINLPTGIDISAVLSEIKRVSKKKAKFIFEIRNSKSPLINFKYRTAKYYDKTISYLRAFCYEDFKKKLELLNFKISKRIDLGFPKGNFSPIIVIEAINND